MFSKELLKCIRTNERYVQIKAGRYIAAFDRTFCMGAKPLDFIEQIDTLMNRGQIFKNDKTSCVPRLKWNGKDIVIKRYNHKGLFHLLRHTIMGSRASRSWLYAHRLMMLGTPTPRPLAYIERYKGLLVWKSYLVTEYVDGQTLHNFQRHGNITPQQHSAVIQQVMNLLDNLSQYRISHGDFETLKYSDYKQRPCPDRP